MYKRKEGEEKKEEKLSLFSSSYLLDIFASRWVDLPLSDLFCDCRLPIPFGVSDGLKECCRFVSGAGRGGPKEEADPLAESSGWVEFAGWRLGGVGGGHFFLIPRSGILSVPVQTIV